MARAFPHWRVISSAVCLTVFLPLTSRGAPRGQHVLLVAPQDITRSGIGARQLVNFSPEGRTNIADISTHTLFGTDDSTVVLVDSSTKANRLLVIDRESLKVIANTAINGVRPDLRMQSIEEFVAVHSKNFTAYFPTFDYEGHRGFGFAEVNWKTGKVRQFPASSLEGIGDPVHLISLPSGFAVSGFGNTIGLFDAGTRSQVLLVHEKGDDYSWITRRMYYAPKTGLMEYYDGQHLQLTDTRLSPVTANPERFPGPEAKSKIFVRTMHGNPCLIWGENEEPKNPAMLPTTISEIVIFDLDTKKEVLRRPLGGSFSQYIQPNESGSRIYFIDQQTGEIFCLDAESQTIRAFARTGVKSVLHSEPVMVEAN